MKECLFCKVYQSNKDRIIEDNESCFAIYDTFPVNLGHALIIPKRHFSSWFEADEKEVQDIARLLKQCKAIIDEAYHPTGYNVGINIGEDAGQTIMHLHVHLIPRYKGDVDNPKGGVRRLKPQLVHYEG